MRRRTALCLALCFIAVVLGGLVPTARAAGGAGGDGADYYALLGVRKSATVAEIRKQYKALAKQWHPDKVQGDEAAKQAAQQKFMAINEAHEVLSDPESRREYDEDRAHPRGGQRGWNPRQQNPFHRYHHQQQYQNWQRAQYHWQQQHQYANTPPLLFSFLSTPLVLMIVVPMVYLLWSAVTAESGDDDNGAAQQQPPRQQRQPQSTSRKDEEKTKKVVLTPMQERALQLAPDLVQVEMGALGVTDLDRLDSHHVVVFLPSVAMLAKMASAGAGVERTAGESSRQGGGGGGSGGGDDEGTKLWRALRDVAATFTRSDRIVFAWTDKSAAAFRQAVQRVRPSFELHHPDPAVLVLKRKKLAGGRGASSSKPSSSSSASAKLGGGGSAGGAGGVAAAPRRLEYAAAIAYVCPRHDRLSPKQFTAPAISAWVANQLCDGMARWKALGAAPLVLQAR